MGHLKASGQSILRTPYAAGEYLAACKMQPSGATG